MFQINEAIKGLHKIFLENLGGDNPSSISLKGYNAQYRCPIDSCPTNEVGHHSYGKNKFSVSYDIWKHHCWVCHEAGSITRVAREYFSKEDVSKIIAYRKKIAEFFKDKIVDRRQVFSFDDLHLEALFTRSIVEEDTVGEFYRKPILKYAFSRGLTWEHIAFYSLSYTKTGKHQRSVIIPSFDVYDKMNFFVARKINDEENPKYTMPWQGKKTDIIFNERLINWNQPLILVEGPMDYLKLHGHNRALLLGTYLGRKSLLFEKLKFYRTPVNILFDVDAIDTANEVAEELVKIGVPTSIVTNHLLTEGVNDVGELRDVSRLIESIPKNELMDLISLMQHKIDRLTGNEDSTHL